MRLKAKEQYQKRKTNPFLRLRRSVSGAISRQLSENGFSKRGISCIKYLPYTIEQLKTYLETLFEPWMNWDNYGQFRVKDWNDHDQSTWRWNLDHIIPQADLLYSSMEESLFLPHNPASRSSLLFDGRNKLSTMLGPF
jgi:hypothetical protein